MVFNHGYSKYYNLFYADKNYEAEVSYLTSLIKKYAPQAKSIIEFGSGTGGHGMLLQKLGFDVTGVERSKDMASVAIAKGLTCEVADITHVDLNKKFDICLSLFHVISYINDNTSLIKVFENARKHLTHEGFFIFDVWFTPAVMGQFPETRVKHMADEESEVTRIAVPVIDNIKNVVEVNYQILVKDKQSGRYEEFNESHSMRHFGCPEIELLAVQSGFTLIKAEEFLTGNNPSIETWGVNFILQVK